MYLTGSSHTPKLARYLERDVVEGESTHVARTLRALELLAAAPRSISELAEQLGVHPRTARRLLGRLSGEGYAERSPSSSGRFSATLKIVGLAGQVLERTDLVGTAFPYVTRLRNRTGEASHLSVPGERDVMHLIQETGESVVMVKPRLGEAVPYHCTAVGKALLAHLPGACERVLRQSLARLTEHTLTDPADLLLELSKIRERGYAVDDLENSLDLRCVAAPVFDHSGETVAALGISAPSMRLAREQLPAIGAVVVEIAAELSGALGFSWRLDSIRRPPSHAGLLEIGARVSREGAT